MKFIQMVMCSEERNSILHSFGNPIQVPDLPHSSSNLFHLNSILNGYYLGLSYTMAAADVSVRQSLPDGRVNDRIANYTAFWEKDSAQDGVAQRENRLDNYTEVINGMYPPLVVAFGAGDDNSFFLLVKGIMMVQLSCMNMVGHNRSTFRGFTR